MEPVRERAAACILHGLAWKARKTKDSAYRTDKWVLIGGTEAGASAKAAETAATTAAVGDKLLTARTSCRSPPPPAASAGGSQCTPAPAPAGSPCQSSPSTPGERCASDQGSGSDTSPRTLYGPLMCPFATILLGTQTTLHSLSSDVATTFTQHVVLPLSKLRVHSTRHKLTLQPTPGGTSPCY